MFFNIENRNIFKITMYEDGGLWYRLGSIRHTFKFYFVDLVFLNQIRDYNLVESKKEL